MSQYYQTTDEAQKMQEKIVSSEPVFQPAWITYLGAVSGVLKALGTDCDVVAAGGYSGYCFLVNVAKGATCPSGPTAMSEETWTEIRRGTRSLGCEIEGWSENKSFPEKPGELSPEDFTRAKNFFDRVKTVIDTDNPAIIWGIPVPEYGIVKGYRDDLYLVSTVRACSTHKLEEDPIRFDALQAPGCLDLIYFTQKIEIDPVKADKEAVERAIQMATGTRVAREHYVAGPAAYEEWASVLEEHESLDLMGNNYAGECYHEGKELATEFLKRLARKYSDFPQFALLNKAAEAYKSTEIALKRFIEIFPGLQYKEITLTQQNRQEGAIQLREAQKHEEEAIKHLGKALDVWKNA